jgi:hypothetical protein
VIALDLAPQLGVDERALVAGDVGEQQLELLANAIVEAVRTFAHLGRRLQGPRSIGDHIGDRVSRGRRAVRGARARRRKH